MERERGGLVKEAERGKGRGGGARGSHHKPNRVSALIRTKTLNYLLYL